MIMMKLFYSYDYNVGNIINLFDDVVYIVYKKVQDVKNGLSIFFLRILLKLICLLQELFLNKCLEFYKN